MRLKRSRVALAFGETLKLARRRRGLSQEQLAAVCNIDRTYPSLLERGQRTPSLSVLLDLAAALHVPPERLVVETAALIEDS
ncbi:MAG: putative transcriptional regulator [Gammaproteobacteria bacterium]|nr:putative transcriptional regulator [Gammaproteobacteria bacterium]